jgi:hypothetical protein
MEQKEKAGLIDKLIRLVERISRNPKQAFVFVILLYVLMPIVVGTAYFWIYRDEFARQYFMTKERDAFIAKLDANKFGEEMPRLIQRTGAVAATIWAVDIVGDKRQIVYSYHANKGEEKEFYGRSYPLFFHERNILDFYKIHRGEVVCNDFLPETDYGDDAVIDDGVTYTCYVSVPPEEGQFVGMIALEFAQKPVAMSADDPVKRRVFETLLVQASRNIVKYGD